MSDTPQPRIDEINDFLETYNPELKKNLAAANPQYIDILKIGQELGDEEVENEELKFRAKVCSAALDTAVKKCTEALPGFKTGLRKMKNLQLYGQLVTAISGASVLTTLSNENKTATYIAGSLSLVGSLVPLIVKTKNQGLNENKQRDIIYGELVQLSITAENNLQELSFFIEKNFNKDGINTVISKSNQLCADIKEKLSYF